MTSIEIQNGMVTPYANNIECVRKTRHDEFDHPSQNERLTQILHIINKRIKPEIENTIVVADVTGNCKPSFCILPKSHSTSRSLFTTNFQDSNSQIIQNFPRMTSKRPFSYDFYDSPSLPIDSSNETELEDGEGICEHCRVEFSDARTHRSSVAHMEMISRQYHWTDVDRLIEKVNEK